MLGYELFNEPFPGSPYPDCVQPGGCPAFDATLTAFNRRVVAAIRSVDRHTLVFYEPNVLFDYGFVTDVGALDDPQAGFAFHDYCPSLSRTGCASEATGFAHARQHVAKTHEALILTEFGSNPFAADLSGMVRRADREMVPWLEWSYCPCTDPTGATPDPLVRDPARPPKGSNLGTLALQTLVEPYPQLIAGSPQSWGFDAVTRTFKLSYRTKRAGGAGVFGTGALTEIATPERIYRGRYAARVSGGEIVSSPGAAVLAVAACPHATSISVTVTASGASHSACRLPARQVGSLTGR